MPRNPDALAHEVALGVMSLRGLLLSAFMTLPQIDPEEATADALPYLGTQLGATFEVLDEALTLTANLRLDSVQGRGRARVKGVKR